jgi:hypothetical protein
MSKYILLGMNQPNSSRNNFRIVSAADNYDQLVKIWETIEEFYSLIGIDGRDGLNETSKKMIEKNPYLSSLYEVYHESILFTVTLVGIFEALKLNSLNVNELRI